MSPKAACLLPRWRGAEAPGSSGLPGLREVRFWLRCFAVVSVVGGGLWISWQGFCGEMPLVETPYRSVGSGLRQLRKEPECRVIRPPVQRNPFPEGR